VFGVDLLVDQPPHRGRGRLRPEHVLAVAAHLADAVDAVRTVGDRGGQIGEHVAGRIHPLTLVGVCQHRRDLRRQPCQIGEFAQHAHPGMRHHTQPVGRHFHPWGDRDILHLRGAFPLE